MTNRSQVRRIPERASYDESALFAILDEALVAHVSFAVAGQPFVIPMAYGRQENTLLLHGSIASRLLETVAKGIETCVCVTLLDGLVLARSVFHHSMNYRSAVIFGTARIIESVDEKTQALERITNHIVPGRCTGARAPSRKEINATSVLAMPIADASVKSRQGPPKDNAGDMELDFWAGLIPISTRFGNPQPDAATTIPVPEHVARYRRG